MVASQTQDDILKAVQDRYGVLSKDHEWERKQLGLSYPQAQVYFDTHPFRVMHAGRRTGKTVLARHEILRAAQNVWGGHVAYIVPNRDIAQYVAWKPLKRGVPQTHLASFRDSEMMLTLASTGTVVQVFAANDPDALRGVDLDFVVFDEAGYCPAETWTELVQPSLTSSGDALFVGTHVGWMGELFQASIDQPNQWGLFRYSSLEGGFMDRDEFDKASKGLDEATIRSEFLI